MPLATGTADLGVFGKAKSYGDYLNEYQDEDLRKQLTQAAPSDVQVYEYVKGLPQAERDLFFKTQRADKILDTGAGFNRYDQNTGTSSPIPGSDKALPPVAQLPYLQHKTIIENASKPLNNDQSNAATYADRMREAEAILGGPKADAGTSRVERGLSALPFGNSLVSDDYQDFDQASRNFVNAVLRKESGAAISPSEFDNAKKQYLPQPGDSKQVLVQKAANRATALAGISRAAGPQYAAPIDGPEDVIQIPTKSVSQIANSPVQKKTLIWGKDI